MRLTLTLLALLAIGGVARADSTDSTIYTYTGNSLDQPGDYNNLPECTCNITGEMTFAAPLELPSTVIEGVGGVPSSYSFSVDGFTLNQANSTIGSFALGIDTWELQLFGANGLTIYVGCVDGCGDGGGATDFAGFGDTGTIGTAIGTPGSWAVETPEPAEWLMLLAGVVALLLWASRSAGGETGRA